MKFVKSSLLRRIIMGYKITKSREHVKKLEPQLQYSIRSSPSYVIETKEPMVEEPASKIMKAEKTEINYAPLKTPNIEEISKTFKVPATTIEKIYNETKDIMSSLPKTPTKEFNATAFRNRIEEIEKTAVNTGAYIAPEIKNHINNAKEMVNQVESIVSPEREEVTGAKKLEELEREKENLEEAKKAIMEKYYNREIDETSIKNIMDNYEQRLVEDDVKIKNLKKKLESLGKRLPKTQEKLTSETKPVMPETTGPGIKEISANIPQIPKMTFKILKIMKPSGVPTGSEIAPEIEVPIQASLKSPSIPQPPEIEQAKKYIKPEGIEIPRIPKKAIKISSLEMEEETSPISLSYPLIPREPAKNESIFAYANIFWDTNTNTYLYNLVEPKLTEKLKDVYKKVKEMLEQRLDIDFSKLKKIEAKEFLDKQIDDVLKYFNLILTENEKKILKYYMNRDFTGLGTIEPLMQDSKIEDISCDGVGIPIFVFHRNPDISSIATNLTFPDAEQLDSFIIRLAQLCGKSISVSDPLLDGTLPDGSRIQATLGTDIARRGSNFTIRRFTEEPLTPVHLMNYGTLDTSILAYLWFAIEYGRSILISGGTASGKTSLLNVLSLFIRPEKKIVSIEDTAELRLPHSHWVPVVARTAIGAEGKGEVDMFELLRESLRQRPDYIIVGEVRGKEAYVLFQQMATGHASLATIHAENIPRLADRLTTPPISLPAGLINSLDIVVFLARMRYKNKFIRKTTEIVEILDFDQDTNTPITNKIFKWNPLNDKFETPNKSFTLKKISDFTGINEKAIKEEIERRIVILEWMKENNILDYRDVHRVFSIYYTDPERLLSIVQGAG